MLSRFVGALSLPEEVVTMLPQIPVSRQTGILQVSDVDLQRVKLPVNDRSPSDITHLFQVVGQNRTNGSNAPTCKPQYYISAFASFIVIIWCSDRSLPVETILL